MYNEIYEKKDIAACIVLSIITCSIYYFYWVFTIMRKIKILNHEMDISVSLELLCFIIVPFYNWYWYYTRAYQLSEGAEKNGYSVENYNVLFLVLSIVGLSIINVAVMQSKLNIIARGENGMRLE